MSDIEKIMLCLVIAFAIYLLMLAYMSVKIIAQYRFAKKHSQNNLRIRLMKSRNDIDKTIQSGIIKR